MMTFRNLDANDDWTFGSGVANYVAQNQAIGLNVETRIYSWLNDCFFDLTAGIDWYNRLGSKGQKLLLDADIQRIILGSYGVTGIVSFSSQLTGRNYNASAEINTIYGQTYLNTLSMDL